MQDQVFSTDYIYLIVEVSVTVYVFLLGLPTLVNQIFLSDDLRRMSNKNYSDSSRWQLLVLTLLLISILVLAYLSAKEGSKESHNAVFDYKDLIATLLFLLMTLLTVWYLFANLLRSKGYRSLIIHSIRKKILQDYNKSGVVQRAYFDDLEYLGIYSKAGAETRTFIESMESLLSDMKDAERNLFDGNPVLTNIIDILCLSVTNSVEPGSRPNMAHVLEIYKNLLMELSNYSTEENQLFFGNETRKIKDCTTKIALAYLKKDYSDMMPLILNVLTLIPRSSDKLFEIGVLALGKKQYRIATNVLSEIMDRHNQDYLKMNNYLGLLAHFYQEGSAARRYALHSLEINKINLDNGGIKDAQEYHYIMSNFETVDHLEYLVERHLTYSALAND